ncbi:TfoX/Sxy family protein [Devosia sp.]|uniref:TfoX/Sxy family protein n=1 Tax=Devosia sp. TaxID=1871048 RepID=UPI003A8CF33B
MSEQSEALADRIRILLGPRPGLTETRMMGGVCFMLHGNMLVGPMKDGALLARVGKAGYAEAVALPGAGPMTFTGRPMSGFVEVRDEGIETDEALMAWIARAEAFVLSLPPKAAKPPKAAAKGQRG